MQIHAYHFTSPLAPAGMYNGITRDVERERAISRPARVWPALPRLQPVGQGDVCTITGTSAPEELDPNEATSVFAPQSREELISAVDLYQEVSSKGDHGPRGPIGKWDVSRITDMTSMFHVTDMSANYFNGDISSTNRNTVSHSSTNRNAG